MRRKLTDDEILTLNLVHGIAGLLSIAIEKGLIVSADKEKKDEVNGEMKVEEIKINVQDIKS